MGSETQSPQQLKVRDLWKRLKNKIPPELQHRLAGISHRLGRTCCYTGLIVIRRLRRVRRGACSLGLLLLGLLGRAKEASLRAVRIFAVRNGISFEWTEQAVQTVRELCRGGGASLKKGVVPCLKYWLDVTARGLLKGLCKLFSSVNYVAPLAAAAVFATVVGVTLRLDFALEVRYNGEQLGYITDESVFDEAETEVLKRIVFEDYIRPDDSIPEFTLAVVGEDQLIDENELTNRLIRASGNELTEATGLYIDDKFMGAVESRSDLDGLLEEIKSEYRTVPDGSGETQEETDGEILSETVEFVKDVQLRDGLYPKTSLVDLRLMEQELNREESQQRVYTAVSGDAPITIAKKNGISYSQLKALNPDIERQLLVGQEVLVEKAVPMLEVKVIRTENFEEDVDFKIEQIQDTSKYQGYTKVTQYGKKGVKEVTAQVTYIDGIEVDREVLDTRMIQEPVNEKIVIGGLRPLEKIPSGARTTSSNFIWPTDGGYVTCLFGSAGYWGHTGMDIGGMGSGAAIRAAASGTVTKVVYSRYGYGYYVMIDHGGGVQTLYAHNSKIYVKVGDWVDQGDLIAGMGRTGNSTGIHVHFEIRVNGKYMNPANYIGTRCPYN